MFTREDLRAVPLFSVLDDDKLDYLSQTSADLRLLPGDYVLHEGETRRALFFLIEGRVEVTKIFDGSERVVGLRERGESFGELPVVLNMAFAVSFRAAQPSRVMRIEAKDFQNVAADSPTFSLAISAAARERVEGLHDIAAEPAQPRIAVIGRQNNASRVLRDFLQRNSIDFDWISSDDASSMVRLRDGTILVDPTVRDLAEAIGLSVTPTRTRYDVAIVGGGPAGLAAAVYGASEGLSTILIEHEAPGGQAGTSSRIENYLGFPFGVSGDELAERALQQAKRLGAEIVVTRVVESIDTDSRTLLLDGAQAIEARTIILALGVSWRRLDIPSVDRLIGRGVYYGAARGEERFVQGKDIYLVGGGNSAGQAAISFANYANCVTLLVRADSLAKSMSQYLIDQLQTKPNIRIETHAQVVDAYGDDALEGIAVANSATGKRCGAMRPRFSS